MVRSARVLAGAALLAFVLGGCPEDGDDRSHDESDGGGQSAGRVARLDVCEAHLDWVGRCSGEPDFSYTTEWGERECPNEIPWRVVEPAYIDATASCFATLPCTSADDACTDAGLRALGIEDESDIAGDALFQRCLETAQSCEELSDDACLSFVAFTRAGRDAAEACLEKPCAAVEACLSDP